MLKFLSEEFALAKPEWGVKRVCVECVTKFYDMQRSPPICPKCGAAIVEHDPQHRPAPDVEPETIEEITEDDALDDEFDDGIDAHDDDEDDLET